MATHAEEHQLLDRALGDVEFHAQRRNFERSQSLFRTFRASLEQHLDQEEQVTFPALDRSGQWTQALATVRAQHVAISAALKSLAAALDQGDLHGFEAQLGDFEAKVREHQATEERLLPADHGHAHP
ncbi:MAG: hypothetical protein K1X89_30030 [Myxococcaceae bacterium]|nr:hypothetical protein [Myxococcaceae bacterium]